MNKYQKELNNINHKILSYNGKELLDVSSLLSSVDTLQELVDKATPKKVHLEGDGYADGNMVYDIAYCPSCGERLTESEGDTLWSAGYCPYCGQALDWGNK